MKGNHIRVFEPVPEVQLNGTVMSLEEMDGKRNSINSCYGYISAGVSAKQIININM